MHRFQNESAVLSFLIIADERSRNPEAWSSVAVMTFAIGFALLLWLFINIWYFLGRRTREFYSTERGSAAQRTQVQMPASPTGTSNRSKVKKHSVKPKLPKSLQSRLDCIDGEALLDLSGVENQVVPAAHIDYVSVHASIVDLVVEDLSGTLDIGRAEQLVTCRGLRVVNCNSTTLTASRAAFEDCEFIDCNFAAFRALGASFVRCVFSGVIRSGIFDCRDGGGAALPFEDNDFRNCDLRDTAFRGGIDLKKQSFSEQQRQLMIPEARKLLAQFETFLAKNNAAAGINRFREYLHRSVVQFHRDEIFMSEDFLRKHVCAFLRDFRGDYAVISRAFAQWASEAEHLCTSAKQDAKPRKA